MTATHFLAGLMLCGTAAALAIPDRPISGYASVVDGDTIRIDDKRIRLWGIDAPERGQPHGPAATQYLRDKVSSNVVSCSPRDTDKYGRVVAQCFVMGRDLGLSMVAGGYALDYPRYSNGHYRDAETAARAERIGMHADAFETPENYRRAHKTR